MKKAKKKRSRRSFLLLLRRRRRIDSDVDRSGAWNWECERLDWGSRPTTARRPSVPSSESGGISFRPAVGDECEAPKGRENVLEILNVFYVFSCFRVILRKRNCSFFFLYFSGSLELLANKKSAAENGVVGDATSRRGRSPTGHGSSRSKPTDAWMWNAYVSADLFAREKQRIRRDDTSKTRPSKTTTQQLPLSLSRPHPLPLFLLLFFFFPSLALQKPNKKKQDLLPVD
jgi:hypothetical protein